jgi:hypothetical protein
VPDTVVKEQAVRIVDPAFFRGEMEERTRAGLRRRELVGKDETARSVKREIDGYRKRAPQELFDRKSGIKITAVRCNRQIEFKKTVLRFAQGIDADFLPSRAFCHRKPDIFRLDRNIHTDTLRHQPRLFLFELT